MATSQNGWTVHTNQDQLKTLSYVTGRVAGGDVYALFLHFCAWFHTTIEPIKNNESWGWAYRPIRGATTGFSNHASGTAIDLNAPNHPMGKLNTFTSTQQAAIRAKLREYHGALKWGGDWKNRPDDMHFEINATPATLAGIVARLGATTPTPQPPAPAPSILKAGSRGAAVTALQRGLNRVFPAYRHAVNPKGRLLTVDGIFGAHTTGWIREFQRRSGLTTDGIVGPATRAALARHAIRW